MQQRSFNMNQKKRNRIKDSSQTIFKGKDYSFVILLLFSLLFKTYSQFNQSLCVPLKLPFANIPKTKPFLHKLSIRKYHKFQTLIASDPSQFIRFIAKNCMEINIRNKVRSLLRTKTNFFCISYNWDHRQIDIHKTHEQYFASVQQHQCNGFVKRAELYLDETIDIGGQQHLVYMVSYGDFRISKMIYGENPIARGFGVCMFDFVYFFIEQKIFAQEKMKFRIWELERSGQQFYYLLMKQTYEKCFHDENENDQDVSQQLEGVSRRNCDQSCTKACFWGQKFIHPRNSGKIEQYDQFTQFRSLKQQYCMEEQPI